MLNEVLNPFIPRQWNFGQTKEFLYGYKDMFDNGLDYNWLENNVNLISPTELGLRAMAEVVVLKRNVVNISNKSFYGGGGEYGSTVEATQVVYGNTIYNSKGVTNDVMFLKLIRLKARLNLCRSVFCVLKAFRSAFDDAVVKGDLSTGTVDVAVSGLDNINYQLLETHKDYITDLLSNSLSLVVTVTLQNPDVAKYDISEYDKAVYG